MFSALTFSLQGTQTPLTPSCDHEAIHKNITSAFENSYILTLPFSYILNLPWGSMHRPSRENPLDATVASIFFHTYLVVSYPTLDESRVAQESPLDATSSFIFSHTHLVVSGPNPRWKSRHFKYFTQKDYNHISHQMEKDFLSIQKGPEFRMTTKEEAPCELRRWVDQFSTKIFKHSLAPIKFFSWSFQFVNVKS